MKESFAEFIKIYLKGMIPFFMTLVLMLLNFLPTHIPFSHFLRPDISMICIYFWVLYRSDLFGLVSVIILGVASDSLSGTPFGINLFVFLLTYVLTLTYWSYVYAKSFLISWVGFALVLASGLICKWLLLSVYYKTFLLLSHIGLTFMVTLLIYPLIARLNIMVQNKYLSFDGEIHE